LGINLLFDEAISDKVVASLEGARDKGAVRSAYLHSIV
jgi:hypothetical protein